VRHLEDENFHSSVLRRNKVCSFVISSHAAGRGQMINLCACVCLCVFNRFLSARYLQKLRTDFDEIALNGDVLE